MDEEFESFVVTDPDLVDEGIDVSGLRTKTDTSLLGNIPGLSGVQYEAFNPTKLTDLMRYFQSGLPTKSTPITTTPVTTTTTPAAGDGGAESERQVTTPVNIPVTTDIGGEELNMDTPLTSIISDPVTGQTQTVKEAMTSDPAYTGTNIVDEVALTGGTPSTNIIAPSGDVFAAGDPLAEEKIDFEAPEPSIFMPNIPIAEQQENFVQGILGKVGQTVDNALRDFRAIPGAIIDDINKTVEVFGKKIDIGKTLAGAAINKIAGAPISLVLSMLPEDSLENTTKRSIVSELSDNNYGFDIGNYSIGQDPFGRNPVSVFGDYEQTLKNDILAVDQSGFQTDEFAEAKKQFAEDYFDKKAERAGGAEIEKGTVLGPGEAPGDLVSLEDLQAERDAEIAAKNELAKLTGDVDFDTTPTTNITTDITSDQIDEFDTTPAVELDPPVKEEGTVLGKLGIERLDDAETNIDTETNEQKLLDEITVEEIENIADRQPEVIEQKKNELAEIYDREVERGEREETPTVTSDINKAKAVIDMPQMLGDVGGGGRDSSPAPSAPARTVSRTDSDFGQFGRRQEATAAGGGNQGGGGGGKIVCTMMNESYGFGSFRNKIWLRHSKGLAPEYQKGYHKIFLPLVRLSKKNIVLKKILEHIAVHRTIDIRQESRGKVHLLGRVYRKILEPICYFVGKHG